MVRAIKVYCDFDGTVAVNDVGDDFFRTFGDGSVEKIWQELRDGKITPRECYEKEFGVLRPIHEPEMEAFLARQTVDPGFAGFFAFCEANGIACRIVSDGFDYYIGRILARYGLERVPFISNRLGCVTDGQNGELRFSPSYPYTDSECSGCANCKRNHILTESGDDDIIVYVGDGFSDRCPVRYADVVFAKGQLVKYCQDRNITYHTYSTFADVQRRLAETRRRKRFKKRREAEMARRDVFMQG